MSVIDMRAVAVLESPKLRFPSISVAWTMMVYCDTFCETETGIVFSKWLILQIKKTLKS